MNRKNSLRLLTVLLLAFLLAGCGAVPDEGAVVTDAPTAPVTAPPETVPQETAPGDEDPVIAVSSTEELLEAIAPGVTIRIAPGYYNMSNYLERVWAQEGESWNAAHPYVQLYECFDGVEVVIQNVDGLNISGDNENLTELVIDPRFGRVLSFENCSNILLSCLVMGHTEVGECFGNVLDFSGCRNVTLSAMDLYGCGVYGIGCFNGTEDVYVYSSTIRECSAGPLNLMECSGVFEFRDCWLVDSETYSWCDITPDMELAFYDCVFGEKETSDFMFMEGIYTENCTWSETYTYPEYSDDVEIDYDPDTMTDASVTQEDLADTYWIGYAMVNPESGEETYLPYADQDGVWTGVYVSLNADGTGYYEHGTDFRNITWKCEEPNFVCLENDDGWYYYMTPYTMGDQLWLLLEADGCLIWCYK